MKPSINLKKLGGSLLFRVVVAIIAGIVCSLFFPDWLGRVFVTFNGLFGNFLNFFVPVLIFALVTPAIAGLGSGAGRWLGVTTGLAYASTILSGLLAYGVITGTYDWLLGGEQFTVVGDINEGALTPYFEVEMPAPFEIMTALLLAFCVGLAMTAVRSETLYACARELQRVILKVISSFVVPLLPLFIFGMFLSLGMNGRIVEILAAFGKVLVLATIMTLMYLLLQYLIAGVVAGVNPLRALRNVVPAYATALGTSSSAATIPVNFQCTLRNRVDPNVAGLVIPLGATIHLAGSMMKIMLFAYAIMHMAGIEVSLIKSIGFIFMLGITMIAAPGVPGGAGMAAAGLLADMMGFTPDQVALMIAAYIAIDSFGTAANVAGDGALALIINRFAAGKISSVVPEKIESPAIDPGEPADGRGSRDVTPCDEP